ncbi:MAG: 50S ribosome-binding GTPase [Desulfomonile tiedjei]|uniref:50S ribosome-binding GTPase n=1 Tax=Desulfomonile tiedjei TaxID=2358 RepID=A0A9D6UZY4_9BACT|nr:50S ribosome-binding GTPase [Desulfomonile tiedjei]
MTRSSILSALENLLGFLQEDAALLMVPEVRDPVLERVRALLDKAAVPAETLYVGILGGTGVGKSTLINALAGKSISQPSDKRPFTDRAVVYRHRDVPRGLEEISDLFRNPDALHDSEVVKDLLLLDLPDFDSVVEDNRKTVLKILPFVDSVVWVVSPEKYADSAFYQFLRKTAIHKENFTFVLNKADELVTKGQPEPHTRLKEVLGDLAFRLKHEAGVERPRIFSLSAAQEFLQETDSSILRDEFIRFREFLMVKREAKEIASIKTINLLEEVRQLGAELDAIVKPAQKAAVLASLKSEDIEEARDERGANLKVIEQEKRLAEILFSLLMSEDRSISPVKWGMKLASIGRSFSVRGTDTRLEEVFRDIAEAIGRTRRSDLEKITARIDSELLLAFSRTEAYRPENKPDRVIASAVSKVSAAFARQVETARNALAGRRSRWTRFFQKLLMLLPVPLLAVKLAGTDAVAAWFDEPSFSGALRVSIQLFTSIFGTEGLTGLVALLVCEMLLVWYLASRRIKYMEGASNGLARSAIELVDGTLATVSGRIRADRRELIERIERGINRLSKVKSDCA